MWHLVKNVVEYAQGKEVLLLSHLILVWILFVSLPHLFFSGTLIYQAVTRNQAISGPETFAIAIPSTWNLFLPLFA